MRTTPLVAVTAALLGGAMLSAPAYADPPATGGCYSPAQPTFGIVPGTGSLGQNQVMTVPLASCNSPLLPGIGAGALTASWPRNDFGSSPASGTIVWANGQRSTISGTWGAFTPAGPFAITSGPGAGHHLQINVAPVGRRYELSSVILNP